MLKANKWVQTLSAALLGLFLAAPASAKSEVQWLEEISKTMNNIGALVNNTIYSTANLVIAMAYTPSPNLQNTAIANQRLIAARAAVNTSLSAASDNMVSEFIKPDGATQQNLYALVPKTQGELKQRVGNFNVNTLLSHDSIEFGGDINKKALSYIQLMANTVNSPGNLTTADLKNVTPEVQNQLSELGNFVAMQSIGLNNLIHMYTRRINIPGLGATSGIFNLTADKLGQPLVNASALQVDKYLADRRIANPKWYRDMETASGNTIARETLYVLAEIRSEMFKQRQQNERMLATMSAMQMETNQILVKLAKLPSMVQPATS